jgi:hypothetical protein
LLNLSEGAAKMLELALLDVRSWDHSSADQLWRILHASPTLRQANWFGFDEPRAELPSHAPWSQLTHITISRVMKEQEVMELVKICTAVIVLDLPFLDQSPTPMDSACVILPNLQTLKFGKSTYDYDTMFDHLVLPSLTCLDIKHGCLPGRSPTGILSFVDGLLARSSCRLQKFNFCDWNMDEDQLITILTLPTLRFLSELELMTCFTDRTALSLTYCQDCTKRGLLPHLTTMTVGESNTTDGVLSNMVSSRLPMLKAFQTQDAFHQGIKLSSKLCCTRDSLVFENLRREGYQFYLSVDPEKQMTI